MTPYITTFTKIISSANTALLKLSEEECAHKSHPNKWSKKELLGHLVDSAYNNHQRFLRAASQDNLVFWGYDQDDWVIRNNYQARTWKEILATWLTVNCHLLELIQAIDDDLLYRKTTDHNFDKICMNLLESKEETCLNYLIWDYIFHLEYHLVQLLPDYQSIHGAYISN